jgi:carbonic anhydrase/acetyltransferase-like protein (isoleucine patch superfamily)
MHPKLGARVFIAENATVIGDVTIGDDASIWYGTVARGDVHYIRIGKRSNIQDNCTLHVTNGTFPLNIDDDVTLGHGVIAHGCTIRRGALIGMGAKVLDGAEIGEYAVVAAGSVVSEGMKVPPRTLVAGVPARVKRPLTDDEVRGLDRYWQHYVEYKDSYLAEPREESGPSK